MWKIMTKSGPLFEEIIIERSAMYIILPNVDKALVEEGTENCNSIVKIEFLWRALKFKRRYGPSGPPLFPMQ